jgi:hypothetical protein
MKVKVKVKLSLSPVQRVTVALSLGVKRPGREAHLHLVPSWRGAKLSTGTKVNLSPCYF